MLTALLLLFVGLYAANLILKGLIFLLRAYNRRHPS